MWERARSVSIGGLVVRVGISIVLLGVLGLVLGWWQWPSVVESTSPTFTLTTESQLGTTITKEIVPSTVAPAQGVSVGEACGVPGLLGLTALGNVVLCSETSLDGSPLANATWRLTAAGEAPSPQLSKTESDAVAAVKELSQVLAQSSDPAVLIFIEETAVAMRLASESGVSPGESFSNLVNGVMNANSLTSEDAVGVAVGVLAGVIVLKGGDDPVAVYSAAAVEWLRSKVEG